jgi:hypothetical protein
MAHMDVRAWRDSELSRSLESDQGLNFSDDGFDFPPTAYPFREFVTMSIFVLAVIALTVWGGWKLISLV